MNSLTTLLGVEAPENTVLTSAELSFRGLIPLALAFVLFMAMAALIVYLYILERGTLGWVRRVILSFLRCALLFLLMLMLFRPVLLAEFEGQRPRGVALLIDSSESMNQQDKRLTEADKLRVALAKKLLPLTTSVDDIKSQANLPPEALKDDPSRLEMVDWVLKHQDLKLLDGLAQHGPTTTYLIGGRVRGLQEEGAALKDKKTLSERIRANLDTLKAQKSLDARTALADGILAVLQRKDGELPSAIVVVSDGQDNASKVTLQEAALECGRAQVPLHIYGVGTSEGGSLQLREMTVPETIFAEDTLSVPLRWRAQGFKKGTVEVTLKLGDKVVAKKDYPVQTGEDLRQTLTFMVPKGKEKEENQELTATIQLKGNDQFQDTISRPLRVVDRKIKILYVEHSPRFEFKFLQPALIRDRRVEPSFLLVNADPKVAQGGPPFLSEFPPTREKFFDAKYNVIILGDVAASYLGKEHMDWIKEFVENRGGLIVLSGRQHMPSTYENTPLAEVLPVEFKPAKFVAEADVRTQEYPPTLTDVGQRTDMLSLADTPEENLKLWQTLPGFHWNYPVTKLRPGASSLVVNPRAKMGDQPMPLVATQFYGKGQVLYLGTDETWRWRFNVQDKHFIRFWGQLIYQMGLPSLLGETSKRVQMALEKSEAILDKPGSVFVRVVDKNFNPIKAPQIEAILDNLSAGPGQDKTRKVILQAIPGREGEYRALLSHDKKGSFELKVTSEGQSYSFPFRVDPPPGHEMEEAGLAEKALREAATLSGGQFYREEDLSRLSSSIQTRRATFTRRQEVVLWNPLILIIFVGLLTTEWVIRKFSNLS